MTRLIHSLVRQRRFRLLFVGLLMTSLFLSFLVVPVEQTHPEATIVTFFDGIWWAVGTVTSVGYGDIVPVTGLGRVIGILLQLIGVLAFGLLTGMVTMALFETKESYYRRRLFERLDTIEEMLKRVDKTVGFEIKEKMEGAESMQSTPSISGTGSKRAERIS